MDKARADPGAEQGGYGPRKCVMSLANIHFIERAQIVAGSMVIGLMFVAWGAATVLLSV